ncbi:hypothetical protein D9615_005571 [Tricholomella constricta]|uniref:FAD dependent oxidoreductase domain-containing protein n=1 Tax=Tricholomella constricta TaxID=117010 RepID=A0A8H5M5R6_9AGAR|nr:hypothetical protein D9615_005571 [Tricholomella constricta]
MKSLQALLAAIVIQSPTMSSLSVPILQLDASQAILELPTLKAPAGLPVPNSTHSFWINTPGANPLAKEGSEGDLTLDADVCIIGAGITGVSAAYHLAKQLGARDDDDAPTVKAVILEARDFCSGATGRNGGHLTPVVFSHFSDRAKTYGTEEAKKIYALEHYTADELLKIIEAQGLQTIVDLVASDHIGLLVTEKEVQDAKVDFDAAESAGVNVNDVTWLSKAEVKQTYGASYPAWKHAGHNLWPLKLVTQLYHLTQKLSPRKFQLHLHTNTPVTSISPSTSVTTSTNSRRWSLATPRGAVQCSYVLHATNAYASHLLPHMHGPTGIIPTRGQVMALRAAAPTAEITTASWGANQGFEYWFPRPAVHGGESENPLIILGGGREASGPDFETYVTDDSVVREEVGKGLREFLPGLFPGKYEKGREPEMEWASIRCFPRLVGPVLISNGNETIADDFKGQYISAGYTGHGMPRAFACAEAVVGMITAEMAGETWNPPNWLPRHFLTTERV